MVPEVQDMTPAAPITRLPVSSCAHCNARLDAASPLRHEAQPSPGDMTVCANCAGALVFDAGYNLRAPSREDMAALPESERAQVRRAQRIVRRMTRKGKP